MNFISAIAWNASFETGCDNQGTIVENSGSGTPIQEAQTFTAPTSGNITKIGFYWRRYGGVVNCELYINSTSGTNPAGSLYHNSITPSISSAETGNNCNGMGWDNFTLSPQVSIVSATKYFVSIRCYSTSDAGSFLFWGRNSVGGWANAERETSSDYVGWSVTGDDFLMGVWGDEILPDDGMFPRIQILKPTMGVNNYGSSPANLSWNATDSNLQSIWYVYNGTNTTITSLSGIPNSTTFNLASSPYNLTLYANDSEGNINSSYIEWSYKILSNGETYNSQTYETASETFTINITANSSLTAAHLIYNGTSYAGTKSGLVWSKTLDIPLGSANKNFYWNFTYAGNQISSTSHIQTINYTNFSICGGTGGNIPFINFTFKDEGDSSVILNGTIPLLTLDYWIGLGSIKKNFTFTNNTANSKYAFCGTPADKTFNVDYTLQYKDQEGTYPQRTLQATQSLTNGTTNTTLYLLVDGIYVTFQVVNSANQVISDVVVTASRQIGGSSVSVGQGTTGSDGTVTLWLNPDFSHTFTFASDNYELYTTTLTPTQSSYTITLGGTTSSTINSTIRGIDYSIFPKNTYLINGTDYTFGFNLTSSYWDVSEYGFNLRLSNGTIISGGSTTTENTLLTLTYNTGNQTIIYMDYYWVINGVYTNATRYWVIMNSEYTDWSIAHFFTDLNNYLNTNMFGIDDFGRYLIIFIIIFLTVGIVSYKYGLTSPLTVSTTIFSIVLFFDIVAGLIPAIKGINHLLTYISALILVLVIFREVQQ
jgi:hypothetical protein